MSASIIDSQRSQMKVVLITGAGDEVGAALGRKFASDGYQVFLQGLPGDPVVELARELRAALFIGDIAVATQAEACIRDVKGQFGRLDVLINHSGLKLHEASVRHHRVSDFDRLIYANIRSTFLMTKFALPHLIETKGAIISTGSEVSSAAARLNPVHAATRAWVETFTIGVAAEVAKDGVRANCVRLGVLGDDHGEQPGSGHVPFGDERFLAIDPDVAETIIQSSALKRAAKPNEVAAVYAFLASSDASFVTGSIYCADGGLAIGGVKLSEIKSGHVKKDQEPSHQSENLDLSPEGV